MAKKEWLALKIRVRKYEQLDVLTGSGEFTKDKGDDENWWDYGTPQAE